MKKALLGLAVIAAGAITGSSYYIGMQAEEIYQEQLEALKQQAPSYGVKIEKSEFERGVFSSNAQLSFVVNSLEEEPVHITTESHVRHGPILWSDDTVKLGQFSTKSSVFLTQGPAEMVEFVDQYMSGHLATADSYVGFDRQTTINAEIPGFDLNKDGTTLSFGGIKMHLSGDMLLEYARGTVDFAQLSVNSQGQSFEAAPSQVTFNYRPFQKDIILGDGEFNLPQIKISSPQLNVVLNHLSLSGKQAIDQGKINFSEQLSVKEIIAPLPVNAITYKLEINRINPEAIKMWGDIVTQIHQAQLSSATPEPPLTEQQQRELVSALLQKGLQLNQALNLSAFGGELSADLDIEYLGLPNNRHPMDVQDPNQFIQAVKANLALNVDEKAVMMSPLANMVPAYLQQGLLNRENGKLVTRATLERGQLNINGIQMPLEQFFQPAPHSPQQQPQSPQTLPHFTPGQP